MKRITEKKQVEVLRNLLKDRETTVDEIWISEDEKPVCIHDTHYANGLNDLLDCIRRSGGELRGYIRIGMCILEFEEQERVFLVYAEDKLEFAWNMLLKYKVKEKKLDITCLQERFVSMK